MTMPKLLLVLLVGLIFEAIGVVYLGRGLKQIGEVSKVSAPEIARVVRRGATNPSILAGVFFEAIFFAVLLVLLSKADVSLVWPLTSLGFVLTTIAARFFLHEQVSLVRWGGVLLITLGAALVSGSQQSGPSESPTSSTDPAELRAP